MTTPTTAATLAPKISALDKIKSLKDQMEAYKIEAIDELNAQIIEKEQELTALRVQLAELTGVSLEPESPTQRRKRSPKVKDIAVKDEASTDVTEGVASAPTDPVAE